MGETDRFVGTALWTAPDVGSVSAEAAEAAEAAEVALLIESCHCRGVGCFSSRARWIHPKAELGTWEYVLVLEGEVRLSEGGTGYVLTPGDLLRLDPGITHGGTAASEPPVSFFWVHFDSSLPGDEAAAMIDSALPKKGRPAAYDRLAVLFRQLLHYEYASGKPSCPYPPGITDHLLRLILAELFAGKREEQDPDSSLYVNICEWCRTNWDKNLTVSEVSAHFGYNEDYLTRLFRKRGGTGLKEYIDERRMEKIRALLVTGKPPVPLKEIARIAGFDDYKVFLKYFRYHEGVTPTAYRDLFPGTHTNNH